MAQATFTSHSRRASGWVSLIALQGGYPAGSAALDLRRQAAGGWPYFVGLQHPERKYVAPGAALAWWHADLRENVDRQDHHLGCGSLRHH